VQRLPNKFGGFTTSTDGDSQITEITNHKYRNDSSFKDQLRYHNSFKSSSFSTVSTDRHSYDNYTMMGDNTTETDTPFEVS
jgi:hypothetical protein